LPHHHYAVEDPIQDDALPGENKGDQIDKDIEKYLEMNILNPDWNFAARHAQATRPGLIDESEEKEECICCLKQINKQEIPLCDNSKEL
jgi:hypothetical protein